MSGYRSKIKAANDKISKPKLSLCTHFYNGLDAVEFQVNRWKDIEPAYLNQMEFVIVDDYTDIQYEIDIGNLPVQAYKITTDINWNQSGCKNLLFYTAQADWLFFFDIDTTATAENIQKIFDRLPTLDVNCFYMPATRYPWGWQKYYCRADGRPLEIPGWGERLPHINCFIIHKTLLETIGGFDEDFAGYYGYEDTYMHNQLILAGAKRIYMEDIFVDIHKEHVTNLNRDMIHNNFVIFQKAKQGFPQPKNPIRFDYVINEQFLTGNNVL